ncbi:MAG: type II toxin-antitoxin system PemK/MazF family toxin [Chromatiales bacterium]|nr:type II toxin-antitoxin system PemK/MazF family toxin [Chromatiales bacterium]
MRRGEIWWMDLSDPVGSEPGFRRPAVVIQSNDFNRSQIRTVVVVAVTSNTALALAPGNVLLPKRSAGLDKDSVVNVSQVATVDKSTLSDRTGQLSASKMRQVETGLRLVFAL